MAVRTLTCINNSQLHGSFAVFQKPPPMATPGDVFALAWLVRPTAPTSRVTFTWVLDYNFFWAETGEQTSEQSFSASETIPADPYGQNFVQLTKDDFGATLFANKSNTGEIGALTIQQLASVTPDTTVVGIGMSGAGTIAIKAAPNITAVFTPHPNYWVIFGNYKAGDVIDLEDISGAVEVTYSEALTSRTATLGLDNVITVSDE